VKVDDFRGRLRVRNRLRIADSRSLVCARNRLRKGDSRSLVRARNRRFPGNIPAGICIQCLGSGPNINAGRFFLSRQSDTRTAAIILAFNHESITPLFMARGLDVGAPTINVHPWDRTLPACFGSRFLGRHASSVLRFPAQASIGAMLRAFSHIYRALAPLPSFTE